jgi:hypothetical protein
MFLDGNKKLFSRLFVALLAPAAAVALLLAAPAQGRGPDRLGPRDDWDALPCFVQRIHEPEGGPYDVGESADIEGDVAVSGCCVFRFDGSEWQVETLLPTCGTALDGPVIASGLPKDDQMGDNAGVVYVYRYDGAEWALEAELFASDPEPDDRFGSSVDVDGDMMVVGAEEFRYPQDRPGSAYVFRCIDGQWIEEAKPLASDGEFGDRFGIEVDIDGESIIVGTLGCGVYCFEREGGIRTEVQKLTMENPSGESHFGLAIARTADYLVVGDHADDDLGPLSGSAIVYQRVGEKWELRQKLLASDGGEKKEFGDDVAISGQTILVGAHESPYSARAYVFRQADGTWLEIFKNIGFRGALDLDEDTGLVGEDNRVSFYGGMIGVDCSDNGTADGCDIFWGTSEDLDGNGIPDECECYADFDGDGDVDTADLLYLLGAWGTPDGDVDFDGDTDTADLLALLAMWGDCPSPPCIWDFNGDGVVDDMDAGILIQHFGDCPDPPAECPWDLNHDGVVDMEDFDIVQAHYGPCP